MTFPNDEEVEQSVYAEFMDEVRDTVNSMQVLLGNLHSKMVGPAEAVAALRRMTHNLKTQGQAVNSPAIKLITARLGDYLETVKEPGTRQIDDIQVFVDKIQGIADGEQADQADTVAMVRALPSKQAAQVDFGVIEQKNVEVLLVLPEKAMSHIVERELAACGYRVSNIRDVFQALEVAVRTRPDLIIASMELGALSGVELGCALSAIASTGDLPFALLTSYEWGHPKLKGLPPRAALIRKGGQFGDDLAETLQRFRIT